MSEVAWARATPGFVLVAVLVGVGVALAGLTFRLPKDGDGAEFARRSETRLYFAVAASTTGLSLGIGVLLLRRWLALATDAPWWALAFAVALSAAALVAARAPIVFLALWDSPLPHHFRRTTPAYALGGLGLIPALSGMILVAETSTSRLPLSAPQDARSAIPILVSSRNDLAVFLGSAAFVIVVAVAATAALRRALIAYSPATDYPSASLLLDGAIYSAALLFLFAPAYVALHRASGAAIEVLAPVSGSEFPDHEWFQLRTDLETLLGLNISLAGAFGAAFAVLTPVASSALAAFLQDGGTSATREPAA